MWTFLAGIGGRVAAGLTVAAAMAGGLLAVRQSGKRAQQTDDLKRSVGDDEKANAARSRVDRLDAAAASDELRREWSRSR